MKGRNDRVKIYVFAQPRNGTLFSEQRQETRIPIAGDKERIDANLSASVIKPEEKQLDNTTYKEAITLAKNNLELPNVNVRTIFKTPRGLFSNDIVRVENYEGLVDAFNLLLTRLNEFNDLASRLKKGPLLSVVSGSGLVIALKFVQTAYNGVQKLNSLSPDSFNLVFNNIASFLVFATLVAAITTHLFGYRATVKKQKTQSCIDNLEEVVRQVSFR